MTDAGSVPLELVRLVCIKKIRKLSEAMSLSNTMQELNKLEIRLKLESILTLLIIYQMKTTSRLKTLKKLKTWNKNTKRMGIEKMDMLVTYNLIRNLKKRSGFYLWANLKEVLLNSDIDKFEIMFNLQDQDIVKCEINEF